MKTVEVLQAARKLIDKPEKFARYNLAQDILGRPVSVNSNCAVAFCMLGALTKTTGEGMGIGYRELQAQVIETGFYTPSVVMFNEEKTHSDVLTLFDRAIQKELEKDNK